MTARLGDGLNRRECADENYRRIDCRAGLNFSANQNKKIPTNDAPNNTGIIIKASCAADMCTFPSFFELSYAQERMRRYCDGSIRLAQLSG